MTALDTGLLPVPRSGSSAALLRAVLAISGELDLRTVLSRVVEAAVDLTDARYGALGVVGGDGQLSEFVTTGLDPGTEASLGPRPRGAGLLGLLLEDPRPIRLESLGSHPASVGVPANHPPMETFLGAPIRIRGTVFGNLYLTDKRSGTFTQEDEDLVVALAHAAALVIDNARTYGLSERRRQWLEASADLAEALQPPITVDEALGEIAVRARTTAGAALCAVVQLPAGGHPIIAAADGAVDTELAPLVRRVIGEVRVAEAGSVAVDVDLGHDRARVVPVLAHLADPAVLILVLDPVAGGVDEDREMLSTFVDQAGLALDRAQAFADRAELAVVSDRARIARDLHDVVIQRLFAAGLKLQAVRLGERIDEAGIGDLVEELDATIKDIRTTIFGLQRRSQDSLRGDVVDLVEEYVDVLGFRPTVRTRGPVDLVVSDRIGENLVAVLREALSNIARHACASAAAVELATTESTVTLEVSDNGIGVPERRVESGLRNARERAKVLGGTFEITPNVGSGTSLRWSCPLEAFDED